MFAMLLAPLALAAQAQAQTPSPVLRAGERVAEVRRSPVWSRRMPQWELVWADFETADGIIPTADGGVMFAQEQTDTIRKLGADDREFVVLRDTHATGSISLDAQGRLFGVQRTCTDSARPFYQSCQELTYVAQLLPEHRVLANSFPDGKPFGRLNDVMADGKGGAYFTVGGAYHVSAAGVVTVVENQNLISNGILLSADGKTLWVTNSDRVIAFDVQADGSTKNRRDFGMLDGDRGGDGMAIDSEGRLYVTASKGVHVLATRWEIHRPHPHATLTDHADVRRPRKEHPLRTDDGRCRPRRKTVDHSTGRPQRGHEHLPHPNARDRLRRPPEIDPGYADVARMWCVSSFARKFRRLCAGCPKRAKELTRRSLATTREPRPYPRVFRIFSSNLSCAAACANSASACAWSILSSLLASASSARCLAASAAASSMSCARMAVSARMVTRFGWISSAPPPTNTEVSPSAVFTRTSPAFSSVSSGACRGVMPSSPSFAGTNTISAAPAKISPSALTMST